MTPLLSLLARSFRSSICVRFRPNQNNPRIRIGRTCFRVTGGRLPSANLAQSCPFVNIFVRVTLALNPSTYMNILWGKTRHEYSLGRRRACAVSQQRVIFVNSPHPLFTHQTLEASCPSKTRQAWTECRSNFMISTRTDTHLFRRIYGDRS